MKWLKLIDEQSIINYNHTSNIRIGITGIKNAYEFFLKYR